MVENPMELRANCAFHIITKMTLDKNEGPLPRAEGKEGHDSQHHGLEGNR